MEDKEDIPKWLCIACLCFGRRLRHITDEKMKSFYLDALNEIPLCEVSSVNPHVCWECEAMIKKAVSFREQAKDSYRILLSYPTEKLQECLLSEVARPSKLTVHKTSLSLCSDSNHEGTGEVVKVVCSSRRRLKGSKNKQINDSIQINKVENDVSSACSSRSVSPTLSDKPADTLKSLCNGRVESYQWDLKGGTSHSPVLCSESNDKADEELMEVNKVEIDVSSLCSSRSLSPTSSDKQTDTLKTPNGQVESYQWELKENVDDILRINVCINDMSDEQMRSGQEKRKRNSFKRKPQKDGRLKKSKQDKSESDQKIITLDLSYEEMLSERDRDLKRESYVNAEYKCDSCIIGYNYKKTYKAHMASKHSLSRGENVCPICKTVVASVESFTTHYKRHMRRYECSICQKRTMDIKVMQQHFYSTHEISLKKYTCDVCGKVSNSIDTHRYHKDTHKARVQCGECDKTFTHRAGLLNHRMTVHELKRKKKVFPCTVCDKEFKWKTSLKRHLEKHKDTSNTVAHCNECKVTFSSLCSYQRHLKNSLKHVSREQLRYICDHCGRRFADKYKIRNHIEEKHLHRSYQCTVCYKSFKNCVGLDQHTRNVHKGRPYNKICHLCGKGFPTRVQLESHIRSHTGERPFICEFCPTTFTQKSNLYKHLRQVHSNSKPKRFSLCKRRREEKSLNPAVEVQKDVFQPPPVLHFSSDAGFVM